MAEQPRQGSRKMRSRSLKHIWHIEPPRERNPLLDTPVVFPTWLGQTLLHSRYRHYLAGMLDCVDVATAVSIQYRNYSSKYPLYKIQLCFQILWRRPPERSKHQPSYVLQFQIWSLWKYICSPNQTTKQQKKRDTFSKRKQKAGPMHHNHRRHCHRQASPLPSYIISGLIFVFVFPYVRSILVYYFLFFYTQL